MSEILSETISNLSLAELGAMANQMYGSYRAAAAEVLAGPHTPELRDMLTFDLRVMQRSVSLLLPDPAEAHSAYDPATEVALGLHAEQLAEDARAIWVTATGTEREVDRAVAVYDIMRLTSKSFIGEGTPGREYLNSQPQFA